ncbi:MAG: UDP-N-acetylmuramoyl-tripeptide--D-alanyl-D-alanine ligase [Burkholderiaceae bacterium]
MMTLQQLHAWLPGSELQGDAQAQVLRVHTDTRTLQAGDLFVALKGERFDANDFLADAKARGATAAIAHQGLGAAGLAGVEVPDTKLALGELAAAWRAQFALPLIAVTGSNGKTTVTQMTASILSAFAPGGMLATQGNFNNDIGVPLTLLRLRGEHRIGVVELGMNHPGEIAYLARIAAPTVALVNNAQREHQEFMQTVEAVARENGAVIEALGSTGTAVYPADDTYAPLWAEMAGERPRITFGAAAQADVRLVSAQWEDGAWQVEAATPAGALRFRLEIAGRHNVINALAALACALAAGVPPSAAAQGLEAFRPVKGRSRAFAVDAGGRKVTVVDDTYNANPDSARAAVDVLAELPGPRLLVLGDMGEVGDQGPAFHEEVGAHAKARGIEHLFTLGEQSARASRAFGAVRHFVGIVELYSAVLAQLGETASMLVKGSRFMKMERVVEAVTAAAQQKKEGSRHAA